MCDDIVCKTTERHHSTTQETSGRNVLISELWNFTKNCFSNKIFSKIINIGWKVNEISIPNFKQNPTPKN